MNAINLLNIKSDYVFKRVFGHVGNEDVTKDFLKSLLKQEISNISLDNNPILEKDLFDDKIGILDIKAKINNDTNVDIEMQVVNKNNIEERILFYWSKLFISLLQPGCDYGLLQKTIVILITDFEYKKTEDIPKYVTQWKIREENHPQLLLTDLLEIYINLLTKVNTF